MVGVTVEGARDEVREGREQHGEEDDYDDEGGHGDDWCGSGRSWIV